MFASPVRRQRGVTLIELIVFIVIVSVGLAGVLTVFNVVVRNSADPLVTKQALAVADALLEEILLKDFCDPTPRVDVTAVLTSGSTSVTGIDPPLDHPATNYSAWRVSGDGIVAGTTVATPLATAVTLSTGAVKTAGAVAISLLPCVDSVEAQREDYDNVRDYNDETTWQPARDVSGAAIFSPPGLYSTKVKVEAITPGSIGTAGSGVADGDVLRVVVSVRAPDQQVYSITGYRYFHD